MSGEEIDDAWREKRRLDNEEHIALLRAAQRLLAIYSTVRGSQLDSVALALENLRECSKKSEAELLDVL